MCHSILGWPKNISATTSTSYFYHQILPYIDKRWLCVWGCIYVGKHYDIKVGCLSGACIYVGKHCDIKVGCLSGACIDVGKHCDIKVGCVWGRG